MCKKHHKCRAMIEKEILDINIGMKNYALLHKVKQMDDLCAEVERLGSLMAAS